MPIEIKHAETVDEFWDFISPIGHFVNDMEKPIFRGQGDSNWNLAPSAFRSSIVNQYAYEHRIKTPFDHLFGFEYLTLLNFLYYCDEGGLIIPQDSIDFRKAMEYTEINRRYSDNSIVGWPSKEYLPFMAMAQHHGIPTRLLDWTLNPFVAAYFAASHVLNMTGEIGEKTEKLCVWCLDSPKAYQFDNTLDFVSVAGSASYNLSAQRGTFLLKREKHSKQDFEYSDGCIKNILDQEDNVTTYQFTLPKELAGKLIERCFKFGVSAASLFPGHEGAAKAVLEYQRMKVWNNIL
ncbi:FRG domain-containing protein [Photobacterium kishitanii]|uniref:FRG domain-containing protein n=1 Tax=Photobacterium kishitanii TaxID=318456 RepID=UPI000D1774B7|nr:FRG domain-containing protein [Photobacterium kishitanii]PSV25493.1 hypothetical protein C0W28_00805 [Photobacterium kishitanii]